VYTPCRVWTVARTNQGTTVLLKNEESEKSLLFFINTAEAQVLLNNINSKAMEKKSLHEYINLLYEKGKFSLKFIEIRPKDNKTPQAFIRAGQRGKDDFTSEVPFCDALVLAVRNGIPVHVPEEYFATKGMILNLVELETKAKKKKLEDKLNLLVEQEEYEKAALIRDRLIELD
jgi:bifunctional DNase/RNase